MKQTQKIILSAFLVAPLFSPLSTLAVAGSPSGNQIRTQTQENRQELVEDRQEVRQEVQEQIQDNRQVMQNQASAAAEKKGLITQLKLQVMQKIQNRIRQKLVNRFDRLQKAQVALEAKIQERSQAGVDVSVVKTELSKVNQFIADYQLQLLSYDNLVVDMNQSDTPIKLRNELSQQSRLINSQLTKYSQTLRQAIRLMINLAKI